MSGYNGWANYETWAVALWLDNDEGSYRWSREITHGAESDIQAADSLKDALEESMPELEGMWADLLLAAFGEIDWLEIARNYREEVHAS